MIFDVLCNLAFDFNVTSKPVIGIFLIVEKKCACRFGLLTILVFF